MHADSQNPHPPEDRPPLARPAAIPLARPLDAELLPVVTPEVPTRDEHPMALAMVSPLRAAAHLVALVGFGFGVLLAVSLLVDPEKYSESMVKTVELFITPTVAILLIAFAWLLVRQAGGGAASLGLSLGKGLAEVGIGLAVTIASYAIFFLTTGLMYMLWPEGFNQIGRNPERIREMVPDFSPGVLLAVMVLVAVTEEVLFRGVLLAHLRCILRSWPAAVVVGSALFAALHAATQERAAVVALFPVAVFWAIVVIWRRSVIPSVIGHTLFNWSMLMLMRFAEQAGG